MSRHFFLLFFILVLSLSLRIPNLANYPSGFTPDEAAFGYNAFSLLKTGLDEWGMPAYELPVSNLKSFGDYKLPLYAFLDVPFVKLFGLNESSTRLPNAILGSLAVLSVYLLAFRLFKSRFVALSSAFLLAISPWGIGLSRGAFEANLAVFSLPLAIYAFLSRKYFSALLMFVFSFYSYHSARFLVPPVLIACFAYQYLASHKMPRLSFSSLIALLFIPGLLSLLGSGMSRAVDVGVFRPTDNWQALMADRFTAVKSGFPGILAKFYYAKPLPILLSISSNYLSYFSPQYLFSSGAGESTYGLVPNTGLLYLIELPLLMLFVYWAIKKPSLHAIFLVVLIILMPIPAALAKGPGFAANRSVLMLPFLCIALALGLKSIRRFNLVFIFLISLSLSHFLVTYAYQSPQALASGMLYGRRELFTKLQQIEPAASQIRVSRNLSESHIYIAFFQQMPPEKYQSISASWSALGKDGFSFLDQTNYSLGKYYFSNLSFGGDDKSVVLVGKPQDFEINYPQLFRVYSPSGDPLIQVSPLRI